MRMKIPVFDMLIRVKERENRTRKLILRIRDSVSKNYPVRSPFLIPDGRGKSIDEFTVGKYLGKGCNGVVFKNGF